MAEEIRVDLDAHEPGSNSRRFRAHRPPLLDVSGYVSVDTDPGDVDTPVTIVNVDGDDPLNGAKLEGGEPEDLAKDRWVATIVIAALKNRTQEA